MDEEDKKNRDHKDFEPEQEEKDAVGAWQSRVTRAEKRFDDFFILLKKLRGYVYGSHKDKSDEQLVRTNMIFATIAGMIPHLYARNPEIAVTPTAGVPGDKIGMVKKFAATAESFLAAVMVKEGKLKKRAKSNLRSAMGTSIGALKLLFQERYAGDPIVVRRVQDAQDNLARVEAIARALKKEDDPATIATKRDEMRTNLMGLLAHNELKIYKGFVIDRIRTDDFLLLDDSVEEFDEYEDASALGHKIWHTVDTYTALFGHEPTTATKYSAPYTLDGAAKAQTPPSANIVGEGQKAGEMYVCVIEIWDKENQVIRTISKGMSRWCREPYAPRVTGQRWYPFYLLGFNLVEGRFRPLSDVELLMGLQDEYNTTRTNYADVRKKSVPIRVFRLTGNLTEDDIKKLVKSESGDWVGVKGNPTVPISQDVMQLEGLKIDPNAYDVTIIRNDMDLVAGVSDASRSNLIKPKTATEAELMAQGMMTRVDERRDTNEDMMSEMAEDALQQALRRFTKAEVQKVCGPEAVWPEGQSTDEIFSMVQVQVRAGSSGKPNAAKEKEQWINLLPVIKETMTGVQEARMSGNFDMANAAVELLRETIRRFGERIDVDSIIPPLEMGEDGKPLMQAQQQVKMQQQMKQLTEQLQNIQEELQACQQALQKAQAGEQVKMIEAQADAARESRQLEINAAKEADIAAREEAEAARTHGYEMQQIQSKEAIAKYEADKRTEVEQDKIESAQETAIITARIKAGVESPEEAKLAKDSAEAADLKQQEARERERQELAELLNRNHESVMALAEGMQKGLANLGDIMGADSEVIPGADGMPVGMRRKPVSRAH